MANQGYQIKSNQIKDRKTSSVDLNKYTTMQYICGDRVKGVYGQSRPKNPRMNALTRLLNHRNKQNAKGRSITVLQQQPNGPTRP